MSDSSKPDDVAAVPAGSTPVPDASQTDTPKEEKQENAPAIEKGIVTLVSVPKKSRARTIGRYNAGFYNGEYGCD